MTLQQILNKASDNPKELFLLDGIGAIVSAIFLGIVLVQLEAYVGMPKNTLYGLAILAVLYAIYSMTCYFLMSKNLMTNWRPYLKIIALANFLHCCLTIYLVAQFYEKLTALGLFYFVVELIIVLAIVFIEWKTAVK